MTDKTPLGKLIAECESGLTRDISPSSKAYLKAFIQSATNLLPEEKQAIDDAIKSEAAREYWEGQGWMRVEGEYKLPHIGEWVLLFNGHWTGVGKRNRIEFGDNEETMWEDETSEYITPYPTHWRPLPAPPNQ